MSESEQGDVEPREAPRGPTAPSEPTHAKESDDSVGTALPLEDVEGPVESAIELVESPAPPGKREEACDPEDPEIQPSTANSIREKT